LALGKGRKLVFRLHELAVVEALLTSILNLANERKVKFFKKIIVSIGELQRLDRELLRNMLIDFLNREGISFEEVIINEELAFFQCNRCGFKWSLEDVRLSDYAREAIHFLPEVVYSFIRCPSCGSRDYDVKSGRVVKVNVEL
jgi:hydrogenase nickel incorporation protein HypA/HybF